MDYWGYYNGADNTTLLPHWSVVVYNPTGQTRYTGNANRETNENAMKMYTLDHITYPTGGSTSFEYEANQYYYGGNREEAGGLRISKITNYTADGVISGVKTYKYGYYGDPEAGYGMMEVYPLEEYFAYSQRGILESTEYGAAEGVFRQRIYSSDPFVDLAPHGSPVVYPSVTEYIGDGTSTTGKIIYNYDYNENSYTEYSNIYNGTNDEDGPIMYQSFINPINDWTNGELLSKDIYKNINGDYQLVSSTNYEYEDTVRDSLRGFHMYPYAVYIQDPCGPISGDELDYAEYAYGWGLLGSAFNYADYYIESGERRLKRSTTILDSVSTSTEYFYDNADHIQPSQTVTTNSKGEQIITHFKYPLDYTITGTPNNSIAQGIQYLQNNHVINPVVEEYTQRSNADGSNLRTVSAELHTYKPTTPFPDVIFSWESSTPSSSFTPTSITSTGVSKDTYYKPALSFDSYDGYGDILQQHLFNDVFHSYIWDYNNEYPVAFAINASQSDIAYTSFEADGKGNWTFSGTPVSTYGGITGTMSYPIFGNPITKSGLTASKAYIVSYWMSEGGASVSGGTESNAITGKTINGWTYYQVTVSGATSITITGSGYMDELRLYPADARMTTYTYKPLTGMTSQCDTKNNITYYEYDGFGRLKLIRDEDGHILKQYDYQYQASNNQ